MFTSLYRNQRHQVQKQRQKQKPRLYVLLACHYYIEGKCSETVGLSEVLSQESQGGDQGPYNMQEQAQIQELVLISLLFTRYH